MSTSRSFTPLTGGGAGNAYQAGDKWGFQTAEKVREGIDIANYNGGHYDLGGSDFIGIVDASFETVVGYREVIINGDSLGGMTLEVVLYYRTSVSTTSVQVRLRNTSDSSNAALGTSSSSTTVVTETLTPTLASGSKTYRLEITGTNANATVFGWGFLRIRKIPA